MYHGTRASSNSGGANMRLDCLVKYTRRKEPRERNDTPITPSN